MKHKNILIVGATSAIAIETARCFAKEGANLMLVARNKEKLQAVEDDLRTLGAREVYTFPADLNDYPKHQEILNSAVRQMTSVDALLVAYGTLTDQSLAQDEPEYAVIEFNNNATSAIGLLTVFANYLEKQQSGCIAVISSVAGDRGRQSNYLYGSAKAALSTFTDGLRNRLYKNNIQVLTIKPGFVDTPMTAHLPKNPLFSSAERIGKSIFKAVKSGKGRILYFPWFWRYVMLAVKFIPTFFLKRLS